MKKFDEVRLYVTLVASEQFDKRLMNFKNVSQLNNSGGDLLARLLTIEITRADADLLSLLFLFCR